MGTEATLTRVSSAAEETPFSPGEVIRFPLLATVAITLFCAAILGPRYARNRELKRLWIAEQFQLVEMEQKNLEREQILSRLDSDPQLAQLLSGQPVSSNALRGESIILPHDLSIHPDALLKPDGNLRSEQPALHVQTEQTVLERTCLWIAASGQLQFGLLVGSIFSLMLAVIPVPRTARQFAGTVTFGVTYLLGNRYRNDPPHQELRGPHRHSAIPSRRSVH